LAYFFLFGQDSESLKNDPTPQLFFYYYFGLLPENDVKPVLAFLGSFKNPLSSCNQTLSP
jgi:hypothetical protein